LIVITSNSSKINGRFDSIEVQSKNGIIESCESLKVQEKYDDHLLSVIIIKESTCGTQSIDKTPEIAMAVIFPILGVGVIAATIIFIVWRKKKQDKDMKKINEKTGTMNGNTIQEDKPIDKDNSFLPDGTNSGFVVTIN